MLDPRFSSKSESRPVPTGQRSRVAAYDLGSNSFHLLVVEADGQGGLLPLEQAQEMVRLGADSLRDGIIPEDSFARGLEALRKLRSLAEPFRPESTVAVATSAIREARNGAEFVSAVQREVGLSVDVLDPFKEAQLIYWGARQTLNLEKHKVALFDVGGGSIKGLVGDAKECLFATSMPMGVLRLRDECRFGGGMSRADMLTAETRVRVVVQPAIRQMQKVGFDFVTFTSGTALALARLAKGSEGKVAPAAGKSGEGLGRHLTLSLENLKALQQRLAESSEDERALIPGVSAMRSDTLLPGTVVLRTLLELTGYPAALVCESALKEGLVVNYFAHRDAGLVADLPEEY
jgi:exopolyphosphatase / guanosine-5'-triphosphate,3'-diphosphate pyrophosphatase